MRVRCSVCVGWSGGSDVDSCDAVSVGVVGQEEGGGGKTWRWGSFDSGCLSDCFGEMKKMGLVIAWPDLVSWLRCWLCSAVASSSDTCTVLDVRTAALSLARPAAGQVAPPRIQL